MAMSEDKENQAALDYFVQTPVTRPMLSYLAQMAGSVLQCEDAASDQAIPTPPATPTPEGAAQDVSNPAFPSLEEFIISIVETSHVQVPTLMPTLVYLARLRKRLGPVAKGIRCAPYRIFLASLILAAKYLNDSSPKTRHWSRYTLVPGYPQFGFDTSEVNLMERQLLYLLDWNLHITDKDLIIHFEPFLAPIRMINRERAERKAQAELHEQRSAKISLPHSCRSNTTPQSPIQRYGTCKTPPNPTNCSNYSYNMIQDDGKDGSQRLIALFEELINSATY